MLSFDPNILKLFRVSKNDLVDTTDYLYFDDKGPELALMYSKLFWPELIEVDGFVLLAMNYDREYFDEVITNYGAENVEGHINLSYLQYLVGVGEYDCDDEIWELLGQTLCETWKQRAQYLFPQKSFVTEFAWYSDDIGDPGVTLYQTKYSSNEKD